MCLHGSTQLGDDLGDPPRLDLVEQIPFGVRLSSSIFAFELTALRSYPFSRSASTGTVQIRSLSPSSDNSREKSSNLWSANDASLPVLS